MNKLLSGFTNEEYVFDKLIIWKDNYWIVTCNKNSHSIPMVEAAYRQIDMDSIMIGSDCPSCVNSTVERSFLGSKAAYFIWRLSENGNIPDLGAFVFGPWENKTKPLGYAHMVSYTQETNWDEAYKKYYPAPPKSRLQLIFEDAEEDKQDNRLWEKSTAEELTNATTNSDYEEDSGQG